MIVFLDNEFRCHVNNDGAMTRVESNFFDGKCRAFAEAWRFIPSGYTWRNSDGFEIHGPTYMCVEDAEMTYAIQAQFEADDSARLADLGIPQEQDFTATRNYPVDAFIGIYGQLFEVIRSIPQYTSIIPGQNVIKTTVEHYLDTLKEEQ